MRRYISYEDYVRRRGKPDEEFGGVPTPIAAEPPAYRAPPEAEQPEPSVSSEPHRVEAEFGKNSASAEPKRTGGWSILILLVCFGLAVACAILLANGLNLGHLGAKTVKVTLPEHKAYCVQMAAPSTAEEAARIAATTRGQGGGGYVYVSDGLYIVLASAYQKEADCDAVIEKLSLSKISAAKYVVEIPAVSVTIAKDSAVREPLEKGGELLWEAFPELYAVSVELDEGDASPDAARLAVGKLLGRVRERIDAFGDVGTDLASVHVKAELVALEGQLDTLFVDRDHDDTFSQDLKYAYLKILRSCENLHKELS